MSLFWIRFRTKIAAKSIFRRLEVIHDPEHRHTNAALQFSLPIFMALHIVERINCHFWPNCAFFEKIYRDQSCLEFNCGEFSSKMKSLQPF